MGAEWQPITKQDLAMSGDLTEANRTGQRSYSLPWFWCLEDGGAIDEIQESGEMSEFYRINWLRAKARVSRWKEEQTIVAHEMQWTINSFKYFREKWIERAQVAESASEAGLQAYAQKQTNLWEGLAKRAEEMFEWARTTPKRDRWRKKGPQAAIITVL
ncbi:hypothetical protein B0H12DRAFT_1029416 [Mycena haematopus]|nr:hypothetical protein B0H12DRAFT_1029416 [Mycena haematopus]